MSHVRRKPQKRGTIYLNRKNIFSLIKLKLNKKFIGVIKTKCQNQLMIIYNKNK